jgi:hypothetical protein
LKYDLLKLRNEGCKQSLLKRRNRSFISLRSFVHPLHVIQTVITPRTKKVYSENDITVAIEQILEGEWIVCKVSAE